MAADKPRPLLQNSLPFNQKKMHEKFNFSPHSSSFFSSKSWTRSIGSTPYWSCICKFFNLLKVEKILKGSLDLIPSPSSSVKIQIMGRKVCLRCKGEAFLGIVNKHLNEKSCWHHPAGFALLLQVNFCTNNLNFHWRWRWWDQIPGYLPKPFLYLCFQEIFENETIR